MRKTLIAASCGLLAALTGQRLAHATDGLVIDACTSCEDDEGGTGGAFRNHVRGQLLQGHDVAAITIDFPHEPGKGVPESRLTENAVADHWIGKPSRALVETGTMDYTVSDTEIDAGEHGRVHLYTFRLKAPEGYSDQEAKIFEDMRLLPYMAYPMGDIYNRIINIGATHKGGILAYQMHVYWNMVMEKEFAKMFRNACQLTDGDPHPVGGDEPTCRRIPIEMWAHSDENAYAGKQDKGSQNERDARTRASVMLKDMMHLSDAVFTVSTPSRDQFLSETDFVGAKLAKLRDDVVGRGMYFAMHLHNPKGKVEGKEFTVDVPFYVDLAELCDPLADPQKTRRACDRPQEKFVLPIFNGIRFTPKEQALKAKSDERRRALAIQAILSQHRDAEALRALHEKVPELGENYWESVREIDPANDRIVLSLGRINPSKNPAVLVDNWDKVTVKGAHLIIVGPIDVSAPKSLQYARDMLKAIALKNKQLGKRLIHFVGLIENPGVLYSGADVFVSPSTAETQGMTVLEAMAAATPVVANSTVPSYREFVSDPGAPTAPSEHAAKDGFGNGFLDVPEGPDFYAKVSMLLAKPELAATLGSRGLETVQEYGIENIAKRTDWAMALVYERLNGARPMRFPVEGLAPVPNWKRILGD